MPIEVDPRLSTSTSVGQTDTFEYRLINNTMIQRGKQGNKMSRVRDLRWVLTWFSLCLSLVASTR